MIDINNDLMEIIKTVGECIIIIVIFYFIIKHQIDKRRNQ